MLTALRWNLSVARKRWSVYGTRNVHGKWTYALRRADTGSVRVWSPQGQLAPYGGWSPSDPAAEADRIMRRHAGVGAAAGAPTESGETGAICAGKSVADV